MLLTVKKQVEETVEFKTPAYYKDEYGAHYFINESGQLITVRNRMVCLWEPSQGEFYIRDIEKVVTKGTTCEREEFEKAYTEAISLFESATTVQL